MYYVIAHGQGGAEWAQLFAIWRFLPIIRFIVQELLILDLFARYTLRAQNLGPFNSFNFSLELHTSLNLLWRLDILDLISHAVDSPFFTSCVQRSLNISIKTAPLV